MFTGTKSAGWGRRTRGLITTLLLSGLAACGGGGGGGGGGSNALSSGGLWDPHLPGPGVGGSPDSWVIGPELDFYPPALQQTYSLDNPGSDPLPWNVQLTKPWLHRTGPASGTLAPGGSVDILVDVDPYGADSAGGDLPSAQVVFKHSDTGATLADYDVIVDPNFPINSSFAQGGNGGWTALSPSPDTRTVYVSSSTGDDANDGLTPETAKRTIAAGAALLTNHKPDWLLLKRGDVWQEALGQWTKSGRSPTEPMVVGWYGSATARPLLQTGSGTGVWVYGNSTTENVAFIGLHFQAHTNDGSSACKGAELLQPCKHILFEDCMFQSYHTNLTLQADGGRHEDLRIRRCVIVDAFAKINSGHSQGLYAWGIDGLLIEENLFDHNGWNTAVPDAGPTIFRHNLYIQNGITGAVVRGNIIANSASHGMQLRCGGTVLNNLFVRDSIALSVGGGNSPEPGGVTAIAMGNVILDGKDIDADNWRGLGLWFENIAQGQAGYNIIANNSQGHAPVALTLAGGTPGTIGVNNLLLEHNIFRNWGGNLRVEGQSWQVSNVNLTNLDVQDLTHNTPLIVHSIVGNTSGVQSSDNRFFAQLVPASAWTNFEGANHTIDYWMAEVGDTTSEDVLASYSSPDVSPATYNATLGGATSVSAFLAEARKQSIANWRPDFLAVRVNRYVRDGFRSP